MSRPWIEFIQSQNLPWQADDLSGLRPGVERRVLSVDADTGACSLLLRYPAGWSAPAGALAVDEEFLVLEGSFEAGGRNYGDKTYAHWPAGFDAGVRTSAAGAVVLTFFSGAPARAAAGATAFDSERLVEGTDTFQVPYTGNFHPEFPPGAGRKLLYKDPLTGDQSWILGTLPMRWAERSELHPVVEEMYLLAGESHGDRGVMRPGAYFWRPPHLAHGPFGTLTGNLYFFRTKGGPLTTTYVDAPVPFHWFPVYAPELPEGLRAFAKETEPAPRCW